MALRPRIATAPRSKYGAKACEEDGYRFASQKERDRYRELKLLVKAGEIHALTVHPPFHLIALTLMGTGQSIGRYTADFQYVETRTNTVITEDVKGGRSTKTEAYQLRKKILKANYGIEITEV